MSMIRKHLGFVRNVMILTLIVAVVVLSLWGIKTQQAQALLSNPTTSAVAAVLYRVGLDPETLTAAGVSTETVNGLVLDLKDAMIADPSGLFSVDSSLVSARLQEDDLGRLIRAGKATPEQVNSYPIAISQLQFAQTQLQDELNTLFTSGTADLAMQQESLISRIRDNRAWELPVAYLVVDRTESEWVQLRDALAHERIVQQLGQLVDPAVQSYLSEVRNNVDVSNALAHLDTNLANVQAAWNASVFGQ